MKHLKKIIFAGFLAWTALYTAVYALTALRGRDFIIKVLGELTRRKVDIGFYDLLPPYNLEIRNLHIHGLLKADRVFISPSIPNLLIGRFALNKVRITSPEITIQRTVPLIHDNKQDLSPAKAGAGAKEKGAAAPAPVKVEKKFPLRLIIKDLKIRDGKIYYVDHIPIPQGLRITVKDLSFKLNNFYSYPSSAVTNFELQGNIPWQMGEKEGSIELEGWMNPQKKDAQAELKVRGINGLYLYPYYSQWVNLEKTHIERATLNFTSNIAALKNNVTAECHLELEEIVFKKSSPEESEEKAHEMVTDIFKTSDQGKIVLDFTIRTKMDRPEFSFWNIKSAVDDRFVEAKRKPSPADFLLLPLKVVEGVIKGTTEVSKAVIDGTFAVGREVKRGVFGKSKKKKE
ncbi:MAG: DUF748 domain-containing protein [Candidatus Omnitrophica bacterium]|nr:DUF748 domain-containing protein [Candidatus Omnitrophota bacterium]